MYSLFSGKIPNVVLMLLITVFLPGHSSVAEDPRNNQVRINTICENDDREPDEGMPVARVYYSKRKEAICTAWLAPNGWFVTAGHCATGYYRFDELQFDVPESDCSGKIQLPAPEYRFRIDQSSLRMGVDLSTQQDWAIFRILPNSTGMPELFRTGSFFRIANERFRSTEKKQVRNTGFGVELRNFEGCRSRNRTMQTSTAEGYHSPGYFIHFADTHMGNSGSPLYVLQAGLAFALGTHRGGGCPNIATSSLHPAFRKALNDAWGRPTLYVDSAGPLSGSSTGAVEAPFQQLETALQKVEDRGEINVAPGRYETNSFSIPNRPLKIRAPFGNFSIVNKQTDQ